ncbi:M23 family metallopeptidase [Streptomyces sp. NPDC005438]|uniref:M23 family metallopeptidase n=1 Tax=Streptomyces sp. NPDC005438 TaxID=3156880 RepID=UPI0033A98D25
MRKALIVAGYCCVWLFLGQEVVDAFVHPTPWKLGMALLVLAVLLIFGSIVRPRKGERHEAVEVDPPVRERWKALNSPADKTPSHGTHQYAQTYAIDIVSAPEGASGTTFGWWPLTRPNREFPAFGQPLLAVGDGEVVRVSDWRRDHLSRTSWPALIYLVFEGVIRSLGGAGWVIGNHVIVRLDTGVYALYAHLHKRSAQVRKGDRVVAGQTLALCGNSGNSTEPHLHFQLMDHFDPELAKGIPFSWRGVGVPATGEAFEVPSLPKAG